MQSPGPLMHLEFMGIYISSLCATQTKSDAERFQMVIKVFKYRSFMRFNFYETKIFI